MAAFNKFNAFTKACAEKVHNLASDQLMVALTSVAPVPTNAVLTDLTQISYTNLSSRVVTTSASAQASGVYKLTLADLVLTASGAVAAFRYVVLYNNTATNKELIGWWDRGSTITMANTETTTLDFDGSGGVLTIT